MKTVLITGGNSGIGKATATSVYLATSGEVKNEFMKSFARFLLSAIIIVCLSSCSTIIFVGKTLEPEIIPEKSTNRIVFFNMFDYTLPEYVKEKNEGSYYAGVKTFAAGLSSFSNDKSFNFFIGDTLRKVNNVGQLNTLLPPDSVIKICAGTKADLLLTLDSMIIFFDWETIVEEDDKGNKSKTKNFYLYTTFYVSLYSAQGNLVNRSLVENSTFYKSRPTLSGLITIEPSIAKAREEVEALSYQAGIDFVNKFYPRTVQEPRKIYLGKAFKESNLCIENRDWYKAIELLEALEKSPDSKIAIKAKHNLSVAREAASVRNN